MEVDWRRTLHAAAVGWIAVQWSAVPVTWLLVLLVAGGLGTAAACGLKFPGL